jgi:hypothetical protein
MSAPPPHPISPPPGPVGSEPQSSTVRRHHTITAASRSARTAARAPISEESQEQQTWVDEELVDPERVRSVGAVGEKGGSLHRQASLPSRYNRGTSLDVSSCSVLLRLVSLTIRSQAYGHGSRGSGSHTPRTLNSLSAIAGQEGEEEEWETDIRVLRNDEEVSCSILYPTLFPLTIWSGDICCRKSAVPVHRSTGSKLAVLNGFTVRRDPLSTPRVCSSEAPIAHIWYLKPENGLGWPEACWNLAKPRPHARSSTSDTQPYWRRRRAHRGFRWSRGRVLLRPASFESGPTTPHQPHQPFSVEHA